MDYLFGESKIEVRDDPVQPMPIQPPMEDALLQALLLGDEITREKAMTIPIVSGSVEFISNMIASMPIRLYKEKNGRVEEIKDDSRVVCLNKDTGDALDAYQMKKAMVEDYLMGKGGYCFIERWRNNVVALRYVSDFHISAIKNNNPIFKDYKLLVDGIQFEPWQFIKVLRNTKDGATGIGLTEEIGKEIETAYRTLLYQLMLVQTGGNKKGFLQSEKKLSQDAINQLRDGWRKMYGVNGKDKESVLVLNDGVTFQEASQTSMEMQLDQNKKALNDEIQNLFHIYPEDFYLTFKMAIYPIMRAFETALDRDLLLEKEKKKGYFFTFDPKEILKVNIKERYEAYKMAKDIGFLTTNEIRREENRNYIEGMDVINVGLGAVLYDINTHTYYTPNTDKVSDPSDGSTLTTEEQSEQLDQTGDIGKEVSDAT